MQDLLKQAIADKTLLSAYKSINQGESGVAASAGTVAEYAKYFVSTGPVVHAHTARFERFSLIDPNIHTVLSGTTQAGS